MKRKDKIFLWINIALQTAAWSVMGYFYFSGNAESIEKSGNIKNNNRIESKVANNFITNRFFKNTFVKQEFFSNPLFMNYAANLTPGKYTQLQELYEWSCALSAPGATISLSPRIFNDLIDIDVQVEMRNKGDVAVRNDTVHLHDKDTAALGISSGGAYFDLPQIDILNLKYEGGIDQLKKLAADYNSYDRRFKCVLHELRHIDHVRYILSIPKDQRSRAVWAADELFATIAGNLGYAHLGSGSKKWNKSFRTKANTRDVDYRLPQNSQQIVDSAIIAALDKLEDHASYRETWLRMEGTEYHQTLELRAPEEKLSAEEAIKRMRTAFVINGKHTDILNLASEAVRKRAENFIKSDDTEMRIVMFAKKHDIKL